MKKKQHTIDALTHTGMILALAAGTLLPFAGHAGDSVGAGDKTAPAAALADIKFSFKLDPRLTGSLYMGDRWVSPPTYNGAAAQGTVEARAEGLDASGRRMTISPQWNPADPEVVMVSPSQGPEVKITVKRAGESRLKVTSQGISKELDIKAVHQGGTIQVQIAQTRPEAPATSAAAPEAAAFKSEKDKLSYAIGANVGNSVGKKSLDVDPEVLIQGFKDALSGNPRLTEDQVHATLLSMQNEAKTKQTASQAEKNRSDAASFLAANKAREGVVTLASGLQYKILKTGDGNRPTADDTIVCHYRGTLIDGTEFDSSYKRGQPAAFPLSKVIKGWTEVFQIMPVGSKWQLFIPPNLAYGERGSRSKIGPNAALVFEVELLSIKDKIDAGAAQPSWGPGKSALVSPASQAK